MKKFTLLLLSALSLHADEPSDSFLTKHLLQILEITGMEPLHNQEPMLDQMNIWAQKNLLRQGERWDEQTDRYEKLSSQLRPLLAELRFINQIVAPINHYQGALIHGSTVNTTKVRIQYLDSEWNRGVRFSSLYFLTGSRPLTAAERSFIPVETEAEMTQFLWNEMDISPDMKSQVEVFFINAPMKQNLSLRPTTEDTVNEWLKTSPPLGHYLAISNAPHIPRQDFILQTLAPKKYSFDTIGPGASENEKMVIFLDELARFLYSLKHLEGYERKP